ncbi:MAG: Xaa-Pro peptidase family protein [Actinomycetota bacterium]|nr:Xaa-Pro peptidase family protein [Actinomycetota bacterium]
MSVNADQRLSSLGTAVSRAGLDAFLASSDESIAYLSGFRPFQLERFFAVAVRVDGSGAIVVPALDTEQASNAPSALELISYGAASDGLNELLGVLHGVRRIGVEQDHLNFARAEGLRARGIEPVAAGELILAQRWCKDASELVKLRRACELVESAIAYSFAALRVGLTERELNGRVESWLRERGASAVHPLILFGESAASPHGEPGDRELRQGDVVCADVSACFDGYWGDLTRCATAGPASTWAREAWEVVVAAQTAAIDACHVGVGAREVDAAQRQVVEASPHLGACLHGAGHAIGMAIHEPPFLVPRIETALEAGMVFTIEPGIYQPGVGGLRLEDEVLVASAGPELLSATHAELMELAA